MAPLPVTRPRGRGGICLGGRRGWRKALRAPGGGGAGWLCEAAGKRRQRRPRCSGFWAPACSLLSVCCPRSQAAPSSPVPRITPTPSFTVPGEASRRSALTGSEWGDTFHSAQILKPPGPQDWGGEGEKGGKRSGPGGGADLRDTFRVPDWSFLNARPVGVEVGG